jgi:hypothetical protein
MHASRMVECGDASAVIVDAHRRLRRGPASGTAYKITQQILDEGES